MRKSYFLLPLLILALTAMAEDTLEIKAWRAPDGSTLYRGIEAGARAWELFDADGDGRCEVAIFLAGGRYTRVEIDTDGDHAADRIYLFDPQGNAEGFLDADGDGVLETPPGTEHERNKILREQGRGGALFKRALEMRFAADAGQIPAVDVENAPPTSPPMQRPAGSEIKLKLNFSILPGQPPVMLQRQDDPVFLGEFAVRARAGVGSSSLARSIQVRTDPTETNPAEKAKLTFSVYPVYIQTPAQLDQPAQTTLHLQIFGHLQREGMGRDIFFISTRLGDSGPTFARAPAFDPAGRLIGHFLVEIER